MHIHTRRKIMKTPEQLKKEIFDFWTMVSLAALASGFMASAHSIADGAVKAWEAKRVKLGLQP